MSALIVQATCETCQTSLEVNALDLFDFDCRCADCGNLLVIDEEAEVEVDSPGPDGQDTQILLRDDDDESAGQGFAEARLGDQELILVPAGDEAEDEDDLGPLLASDALTDQELTERALVYGEFSDEELVERALVYGEDDDELGEDEYLVEEDDLAEDEADAPGELADYEYQAGAYTEYVHPGREAETRRLEDEPPEPEVEPTRTDEDALTTLPADSLDSIYERWAEDDDDEATPGELDPYELAAQALLGGPLPGLGLSTPLAERRTDLLEGTAAGDAPPLPAWDGGDTGEVRNLATQDPPEKKHASLPAEEGLELEGLVEVVQVAPGETKGRGSRTYEREQVLGKMGGVELTASPSPPPPPPLPSVPPPPPQPISPEDDLGPRGTLFPEDLDWLALLEDRLPEQEGGEGESDGRHVIRLPEGVAPVKTDTDVVRLFQATVAKLEAGGAQAAEALLRGGPSDSRPVRRFSAETAKSPQHTDTPPPPSKVRDTPTQDHPRPARTPLPDEETQTFKKYEESSVSKAPTGKITDSRVVRRPRLKHASSHSSVPRPKLTGSHGPSARLAGQARRVVEEFRREDLDAALVCAREVGSEEADQFRQLYQRIFHARNGSSPRVVLVTSARPREGKTAVASNLAIVGARIPGAGALLVDADPRGDGVLRAFGQRATMEGLLEALQTRKTPDNYVVQFNLGNLDVVPLGIRGSDASELIASQRMGEFLSTLRTAYPNSSVIVDGSSVLHHADPLVLARNVDGVVLVVRAGKTPRAEVERAAELIGPERLLGVVLNDAAPVG